MMGKNLSEDIIADNFPNLGRKQTSMSLKHRVPNKMHPKMSTSMHTLIKMEKIKDKERVLKAAR